ncbi:tyrosine decarboxylase MfnA [Archaeoglobus sp.]
MEILEELKAFRCKDIPYSRVLSSMCTIPHPIAVKAHVEFINTNLGDPAIFRGSAELEREVIGMIGKLLHHSNAKGYVTSGGTEANVQAVRAFRNLKKVERPNVVVPESAHFSFDKAGDVLRVEVRKAKLDDEFKVDVGDVERLIDENTVGIVGIAGTTALGQIDPIEELSKLALEKDVFLHVDSAFGGFVIPFLDLDVKFDFELEGVSSVTVDPHKMGLATIPAGCILFRDSSFLKALVVETPYLITEEQFSLTGTRPATGVASTYAVMKLLGFEGFRRIVRDCIKATRYLVEKMNDLGFEPVIEPVMNVVCFKCEKAFEIRNELYKRGWVISAIRNPRALRFVVMPHANFNVIDEFIEELKKVLRKF